MRRLDLKAKLAEQKSVVKAAIITGFCTIAVALVGLLRKDSPPSPASPALPAVSVSTNIENVPSQVPKSTTVWPNRLVLQQFAINTKDSLYELCDPDQDCPSVFGWPPSSVNSWVPSAEWEAVVAGDPGSSFVQEVAKENQGAQGQASRNYIKNPKYYQDRLNPVFDVVVVNRGETIEALTDIKAVVYRSDPSAQGDGEENSQSAVIPILNRYVVVLAERLGTVRRLPYPIKVPAIPPIAIPPNRPARFQVEIVCKTPAAWSFEMQLGFKFGGDTEVKTSKFRLSC